MMEDGEWRTHLLNEFFSTSSVFSPAFLCALRVSVFQPLHFSVTVIGNAGLYCTNVSFPTFVSARYTTSRVPTSLLPLIVTFILPNESVPFSVSGTGFILRW